MAKIKVLISDLISEKGIELLEREVEVDIRPDLSHDELKEEIGQYDGIIVRSGTTLDEDILSGADKLKAIGRAGTGYDNINISAATKKGIIVFNTPNSNTVSAVEHTMGMMLALARNIPQAHASTIQGLWERKKFLGTELYGKVLGVIGLGKIGTLVADRARAFGMKVKAYDEYVSRKHAEKHNVELLSLDELLAKADFITLHTPLTDETYHLLGEEEFMKMKEGVRIVNCARGENVDSQALADALENGKVAGAALDSHENEPFNPAEYSLTNYEDRVVMTCHLGASTSEAMDRVATNAAEQLLEVLNGNLPLSPLNIGDVDLDEASKPVLDLAECLGKFASGSLNGGRVEQIEIELGAGDMQGQEDLIAIHAVKEILGRILGGRINMVNALVVAEERGIDIKKSFIDKSEDFNNYLRVTLNTDKGNYSAAGDIEVGGPRLVEVDGYRVELSLAGKFLVLVYKDKPGVIGRIGTILGENDINIGSMHVGRDREMEMAIMLLKADTRVGKEVREEIKTIAEVEIDEVKYIEIKE